MTRPEAVRLAPGEGWIVTAADRDGPVVRLRVRGHDGRELEAVVTGVEHPSVGERVSVEVDAGGVFQVPLWEEDQLEPEAPG